MNIDRRGELRDYCRNLQSQGQHVPFRDFFRTARQLCRALAQVHVRGLIHRDVSATHIWLDERHEAHLGDFDRAMSLDEPPPDHGGPPAAEGYPAPELLSDAPDARADLYSVGGVLYELLTGTEPPLAGQRAQLAPPSRWRSDVPPGLDKLILSMLAAHREDRPPSAQAVLDELRNIEKTADLESLISGGESTRLEFKQTMQWDTALHKRNPELLRACVKTVCAFLNGEGGILLIGVANSGEPTGLEDDIRDFKDRKTTDGFESRFRDALVAGLDPESSHLVTMSFPVVRGVQICRVDVERSPHPVFLVQEHPAAVLHTGRRNPAAADQVSLMRRTHPPAGVLRTQGKCVTTAGCPESSRVHRRSLGITPRESSRPRHGIVRLRYLDCSTCGERRQPTWSH